VFSAGCTERSKKQKLFLKAICLVPAPPPADYSKQAHAYTEQNP
jgi:hypothetical protein